MLLPTERKEFFPSKKVGETEFVTCGEDVRKTTSLSKVTRVSLGLYKQIVSHSENNCKNFSGDNKRRFSILEFFVEEFSVLILYEVEQQL